MIGREQIQTWWAKERERDFTKREYMLLGALFGAIGTSLVALLVLRLVFFRA